ncbi:MAG: VCBS repeat-containing protein [Anaerolineae bacterium]|nr:VCBS repeat-containing protein [Anaerolineae bacterium]
MFLYQEINQGQVGNGRSATIGIQSEKQGLALQFGCNLPVITNTSQVWFAHPERPNGDVGLAAPPLLPDTAVSQATTPTVKGATADLLHQLNLRGEPALSDLHRQWMAQSPPITAVWQRTDLTGDGLAELVLLRHSTIEYPTLSQLTVLAPEADGQWLVLLDRALSSRTQIIPAVEIEYTGDLTQDGIADLLLISPDTGQLFALTATFGKPMLTAVPDNCSGGLAVLDVNGDGADDIARDGCVRDGRVYTIWNGQSFVNTP